MARNSYSDSYNGITAGNRAKASDINNALAKMQNVSDKLTSATTNADSYASFTANSANHNMYPSAKLLHMVKGHLDSLIPSKADDSTVAHLAGSEDIYGQKHFSVAPTVPTKGNIPANANGTTIPTTQAQVYAVNNANLELTSNRVDSSAWNNNNTSMTKYPTCRAVQAAIDSIDASGFPTPPDPPPPTPAPTLGPAAPSTKFIFTGDVQIFTVPEDGTYRLEVCGAQGGNVNNYFGGKGGYTKCNISLTTGNTLYVYVGGQGGYNGGGVSTGNGKGTLYGGGATDIRLGGQNLTNRIIVAGGGGGAGSSIDGGPGNDDSHINSSLGIGSSYGHGCSNNVGAGGGGLHGGLSGSDSGGAIAKGYGGSGGFVGNATDGSAETGIREGDGIARITLLSEGPLWVPDEGPLWEDGILAEETL
ncbi:hypothetical protein NO2_0255 [Candidatus Termititenax persephonae]|uniref:receptor protein-tyrosine kinase n=1 Tax=Candidatus Termititenax persephonae TaxID=2218525 RepID=A0A388TFR7_9BACT|nr:hypothetical protein NO2_0255 [Candidatus Termititenax persephonae]